MKSIITSMFILVCLFTQAQEKKITYSLNAGYVNSNFKLDNTKDFESSARSSFNAGFSVRRHFTDKFSLQSGLFLIGKGGELSYNDRPAEDDGDWTFSQPTGQITIGQSPNAGDYLRKSMSGVRSESNIVSVILPIENAESLVSAKIEASIRYLEIPLNGIYTLNTNNGQVQIGAGPYYAFGISGRVKKAITAMEEGEHTVNTNEKVKFGNLDDDDFRRHDFGLNLLVGFRFNNKIITKAGYGLGLADISTGSNDGSIKNKLFNIGLGYSLN